MHDPLEIRSSLTRREMISAFLFDSLLHSMRPLLDRLAVMNALFYMVLLLIGWEMPLGWACILGILAGFLVAIAILIVHLFESLRPYIDVLPLDMVFAFDPENETFELNTKFSRRKFSLRCITEMHRSRRILFLMRGSSQIIMLGCRDFPSGEMLEHFVALVQKKIAETAPASEVAALSLPSKRPERVLSLKHLIWLLILLGLAVFFWSEYASWRKMSQQWEETTLQTPAPPPFTSPSLPLNSH